MSQICPICKKRSRIFRGRNKLRGNYNPSTKRRRKPNLQWARIPDTEKRPVFKEFKGKRIKMCTKCLKTLSKPIKK